MEDKEKQVNNTPTPPAPAAQTDQGRGPKSFGVASDEKRKFDHDRAHRGGGRGRGGKDGRKRGDGRGRGDRPKPEFDQKSIDVRRVARVVAGGRRFSFSVAMIVGDHKGRVGVGTGKGADVSSAMDKAAKDARKHVVTLRLTKTNSIAHEVSAKSSSAIVKIIPAPSRGLVAGSSVRNVLELAGVTDVTAKILSGSKNRLNMARAALSALTSLRPNRPTMTAPAEKSGEAQ